MPVRKLLILFGILAVVAMPFSAGHAVCTPGNEICVDGSGGPDSGGGCLNYNSAEAGFGETCGDYDMFEGGGGAGVCSDNIVVLGYLGGCFGAGGTAGELGGGGYIVLNTAATGCNVAFVYVDTVTGYGYGTDTCD